MTRKLTDEQVKAIDSLFEDDKGKLNYYVFCGNVNKQIDVRVYASQERMKYLVSAGTDNYEALGMGKFETPDEAISYAEHLLNQRYCWLPQQQAWIMSGEVYNFANNGANKVMELATLTDDSIFKAHHVWYELADGTPQCCPIPNEFTKGITITADSPIWDAVKGVEVQEYTPKEGTTT
jgi:hypothetical protein